jgi:antitoxin (DNA-binding transcriptional repressor) of toxin-antitoxin stability system
VKIENIRAVKANLNRIVGELPKRGSVVITKNGRACAVLMAVTDDTDLEVVALSQNAAFWGMFDRAATEAEETGFIPLDALVQSKPKRIAASQAVSGSPRPRRRR